MAVWVTTDLHGNYDLWEQIKNFLKEDDTLIFLGDAIDRGSRGFEIFKELLEHPQVVYLRGNHEDIMYNAYCASGPAATEYFKSWMDNDGQATLENIKEIGLDVETKLELIQKIRTLPHYAEYDNNNSLKFILCHAGYTPGNYFDNLYEDQKDQKMLWDRHHFNIPWSDDKKYMSTIVVHGHTPILLQKQMNLRFKDASGLAPYWYENNHKINLDAATANTGMAFLFNLDTLEYEVFIANPDYVVTNRRKNKQGDRNK